LRHEQESSSRHLACGALALVLLPEGLFLFGPDNVVTNPCDLEWIAVLVAQFACKTCYLLSLATAFWESHVCMDVCKKLNKETHTNVTSKVEFAHIKFTASSPC
jgi:hypothetical protein